jgi:hypothetical protein
VVLGEQQRSGPLRPVDLIADEQHATVVGRVGEVGEVEAVAFDRLRRLDRRRDEQAAGVRGDRAQLVEGLAGGIDHHDFAVPDRGADRDAGRRPG